MQPGDYGLWYDLVAGSFGVKLSVIQTGCNNPPVTYYCSPQTLQYHRRHKTNKKEVKKMD